MFSVAITEFHKLGNLLRKEIHSLKFWKPRSPVLKCWQPARAFLRYLSMAESERVRETRARNPLCDL